MTYFFTLHSQWLKTRCQVPPKYSTPILGSCMKSILLPSTVLVELIFPTFHHWAYTWLGGQRFIWGVLTSTVTLCTLHPDLVIFDTEQACPDIYHSHIQLPTRLPYQNVEWNVKVFYNLLLSTIWAAEWTRVKWSHLQIFSHQTTKCAESLDQKIIKNT